MKITFINNKMRYEYRFKKNLEFIIFFYKSKLEIKFSCYQHSIICIIYCDRFSYLYI